MRKGSLCLSVGQIFGAVCILATSGLATSPAAANINLEFRPADQTVSVGDTVSVGLYAVSDDKTDQFMASAQVIVAWEPAFLQLLGNDDTGAVALLASFFPINDPYNLNESVPPQDGDGIYVAFAPLGNPVAATPKGTLLTTFQFKAVAETFNTPVDILGFGGSPVGETIVFDATVPNLDVTGTLTGAKVEVAATSSPADITGPVGVPDGCVDAFDLGAMLGAWCSAVNDPIPPSPPCENCTPANLAVADISGAANVPDGCVDAFDLAKLLAEWCSVAGGNPCGTCF